MLWSGTRRERTVYHVPDCVPATDEARLEHAILQRWLRSCGISEEEAAREAERLQQAANDYARRFDFLVTAFGPRLRPKRWASALLEAARPVVMRLQHIYSRELDRWWEEAHRYAREKAGPEPPPSDYAACEAWWDKYHEAVAEYRQRTPLPLALWPDRFRVPAFRQAAETATSWEKVQQGIAALS